MSTNLIKNTSAISTLSKGGASLTWDDAIMTWNAITGTWDSPGPVASSISKSTSTLSTVIKS